MSFIERLDELIDLRDTTRQAVAKHAGLAKSTISDWARTGALPRADVAIRIAEYLNTSVEYLITGKVSSNAEVISELRKMVESFRKNVDRIV